MEQFQIIDKNRVLKNQFPLTFNYLDFGTGFENYLAQTKKVRL